MQYLMFLIPTVVSTGLTLRIEKDRPGIRALTLGLEMANY